MGKRKTNIEFINESNIIHNNKYDYSLINYINNKFKIKIICKKCNNIFEQKPQNHLKGNGCPNCYGTHKYTTNEFIQKSINIHNDKYDYSLVQYKGSHIKIKIICKKCNNIFEQKPSDHLNNHGCPKCKNKNITTDDFIQKSNIIHNNKYDYSLVQYKNSKLKVKIICKKCNSIFEQKPNDHLNKNGCPICGGTQKLTAKKFIEKSNIIHNNKYDYSLVDYKNNKTVVKIICNIHGIFEQKPLHHMNGIGCPKCNISKGEKEIKKILNKYSINFIEQKKFDKCKNIKLLPFDFYLIDFNVCIEFDGEQHFNKNHFFNKKNNYENQKKRDNIKTNFCIDNKIKLIRLNYLDNVENNIMKIIKQITKINY